MAHPSDLADLASLAKLDWLAALTAASANLLPAMLVATLGIALPDISRALLLSEIEAGGLFSVLFLVATVASAVAGRLSDIIGRKAVLVAGLAVLSCGFAGAGLSPSYPAMLALLGLSGLGYGFITPSLYALMSDLLPQRRGVGAAMVSVCYGIGGAFGAVLAGFVIQQASWRAALLSVGLTGAGVMALQIVRVRNVAARRPAHYKVSHRKAYSRTLLLLGVAEFFGASVFWSSAAWTPTVLRTVKQLDLAETGWVMGVWGLTPMIGALLLGALSDRYGRRPVILWSAYPGAAAAFVVYYWLASPAALAFGLALFGTLKATVPTLIVPLAQESTADESAGAATGFIMAMHYISAVASPLIAAELIAATGDMILTMVLTSSLPLCVYGAFVASVREKRAADGEPR